MIASASRHTTELAPCSFTGTYSSQACKRLAKEAPLTRRVHSSRYVRSLSGPSTIMVGTCSECIGPSTILLIGCRGSEPGFEQTRGRSVAVPALSSLTNRISIRHRYTSWSGDGPHRKLLRKYTSSEQEPKTRKCRGFSTIVRRSTTGQAGGQQSGRGGDRACPVYPPHPPYAER
jgi:hypothetical protein